MLKLSERLRDGVRKDFLGFGIWLTFLIVTAANFSSRDFDSKIATTFLGLIMFSILLNSCWAKFRTVVILAEEEVAPLEERWTTVWLAEVKNGHGLFLGKTLEDAVAAEEKASQELDNAWSAARREWNSYGKWKKKILELRNLDESEFCRNCTGAELRSLWQAQARREGLRVVESIMKLTLRDLKKD